MPGRSKRDGAAAAPPSDDVLLYSTTEGRQRFPDILQVSYGDKAVIGFDRYGRALGGVVPIEAVRILAGYEDTVDEDVKRRMEKTARLLLAKLPREAALCGIKDSESELVDMENVTARRQAKADVVTGRHKKSTPA